MKSFIAYTDGACSGNPGPGGWGVLVIDGEIHREISGFEQETTNNRMELMAAIQALQAVPINSTIKIVTDSEYVKQGITAWIHNWKKNNWKTANKKPVKNKDLWEELDSLSQNYQVVWEWVKGHSGDEYNDKADELARNAIDNKILVE